MPSRRGCYGALSHGPPSGALAAWARGPRPSWGELPGGAWSGDRPPRLQGGRFPAAGRSCLVPVSAGNSVGDVKFEVLCFRGDGMLFCGSVLCAGRRKGA